MSQWTHTLKHHLGTQWHGHQIKALAAFSLGIAVAQDCRLSQVALFGADEATPRSRERRWQRFLANPRIRVVEGKRPLFQTVLCWLSDQRLLLLLDETPLKNDLRCMTLSLGYKGRSVPLAWSAYKTNQPPLPREALIRSLLNQAQDLLPDAEVILMADRGLSDPNLLDMAKERGWHYLLRVQHQTKLLFEDGSSPSIGLLQRTKGSFFGAARAFEDAGWRSVNAVAVPGQKGDPWLLVTDLAPSRSCCDLYRKRMWQEESFRDQKSSGFQWQKSLVRQPEHVNRLLLVLAVACLLLTVLGQWLLQTGQDRLFEPATRRQLSVFQLGRRFFQLAGQIVIRIPDQLRLTSPASLLNPT
jgi:hypothetical protein